MFLKIKISKHKLLEENNVVTFDSYFEMDFGLE